AGDPAGGLLDAIDPALALELVEAAAKSRHVLIATHPAFDACVVVLSHEIVLPAGIAPARAIDEPGHAGAERQCGERVVAQHADESAARVPGLFGDGLSRLRRQISRAELVGEGIDVLRHALPGVLDAALDLVRAAVVPVASGRLRGRVEIRSLVHDRCSLTHWRSSLRVLTVR